MILQRLCEYYDRLAGDPRIDVPRYGYFSLGVTFEVVIEDDGSLIGINDLRERSGSKLRAVSMILPGAAKPSGSGLNPGDYGWDRTDYMLGYLDPDSLKDDERDKKLRRTAEAHEAFRIRMAERAADVQSPNLTAFVRFLEKWDPADSASWPILKEVSGTFGVVRVGRGSRRFLHDDPAVNAACTASSGTEIGECLITGSEETIARIHEIKIKGVNGSQSSGASVVSFNDKSAESYAKKQSVNAPIGEPSAFKYATALNELLDRDKGRRIQVGDATCLFWAERATPAESLFGLALAGPDKDAEDSEQVRALQASLSRIRQGQAQAPDGDTKFYVLGLSPNASRLSVRFWYAGTVDEMLCRVVSHQQDLEIVRSPKDREFLPLWLLLAQTARETKEIPPLLGGALTRSVLTGGKYPEALLAAVMRRIRADRGIRHPRAAIIKAILNRNHNKEVPVALDPQRPEAAYQLGRLFAALEKAQEDALPGLNATIKDRYFGAASATPGAVFPRLIRMSQHHVGKLDGGKKVVAEKRVQEIVGRIDNFPSHLGLTDQGLFALGYYHQRQDLFTKKSDKGTQEEN